MEATDGVSTFAVASPPPAEAQTEIGQQQQTSPDSVRASPGKVTPRKRGAKAVESDEGEDNDEHTPSTKKVKTTPKSEKLRKRKVRLFLELRIQKSTHFQ